jgi:hypothetical protein
MAQSFEHAFGGLQMMKKKIKFIITVIVFIAFFFAMFSYIVNGPVDRNEHMYISAGVLIQDNALYKDFAYLQMPYLPFIYGLLYKLTGTTHYLLWSRLLGFVFAILSALLIYFTAYRLSRSWSISVITFVFFVTNDIIMRVMAEASNYIAPIALSLVCLYLFVVSVSEKRVKSLGVFFSGMFLSFAIGVKLYYAVLFLPFLMISLLYPVSLRFRKRIIKNSLPLLIGMVVGLLPAFYYMINSLDIFVFNNFGYHTINTTWRELTGHPYLSLVSRVDFAWIALQSSSSVAIIGVLFLLFVICNQRQCLRTSLEIFLTKENSLLVVSLVITTATMFTLKPIFIQYFALPLPFLIILISSWYRKISVRDKYWVRTRLTCLALVCIVFTGKDLFKDIAQLHHDDKWGAISVHTTAEQIRNDIGLLREGEKVATLSPLYVLEAGLPIYNELSTGVFLYRVGDFIPDDKKKLYVATSPGSLLSLFESDPPKAIFVGFERNLDDAFIQYAQANHYTRIQTDYDEGILYVRKEP